MKESDVRRMLISKWEEFADCTPIENSAGSGIPDLNVSFCHFDFWVEIKYKEELPKRNTTPVVKGLLRPSQKVWMERRLDMGARNIFFFVRIGDEFFLYHVQNKEMMEALEVINGEELYQRSIWYTVVRSKDNWKDALSKMLAHFATGE